MEKNIDIQEKLEEVVFRDANDSDLKRENGNVDGDTSMAKMLQLGSIASKSLVSSFLQAEHLKAHKDGNIHIHDLDFATIGTTTCNQINLDNLFKGGFFTGHGHLREPGSISTYAALTAIAIQSNQNDQHGGQSVPALDYYLAPGIIKSFVKRLKENMSKFFEIQYCLDTEESISKSETILGKYGEVRSIDFNQSEKDKLKIIILGEILTTGIGLEDGTETMKQGDRMLEFILSKSLKEVDRETFQAMEGLVHNLNTMHSRAGAQIPFSSINFGTDISVEGRMVSRNLLLAQEKGLGNGETAIFPILIFKVKDGVNSGKEDPNYDLFKLACRVSSKRMFPNFAFLDAPHNLQYYDKNDFNTEVAYMGCVDGVELITYRIEDKLYVEGFERAWNRLSKSNKVLKYGVSEYLDLKNVTIYDSNKNDFVKCKKIIKNPDKGNWHRIKFNNGRTLLATGDHPLPIEGKGRTFVKDMQVGDKGYANWTQYSEESVNYDVDIAWMLGLILCDGAYSNSLCVSLGTDEDDLCNHYRETHEKAYGSRPQKIIRNRGSKGCYVDMLTKGTQLDIRKELESFYGGLNKCDRHIPSEVFSWNREAKMSFLAGMIDSDGYVSSIRNRGSRVQIGSTNHELALQQASLAQSLGYPAKVYLNKYNSSNSEEIRYRVEFAIGEELAKYIKSAKKLRNVQKPSKLKTPELIKIVEIEEIGSRNRNSFDVETESDMFDVSGILSHNCRTRTIANINGPEIVTGRGNLSFTSINLPRLAINHMSHDRSNPDLNGFFRELDELIEISINQLLDRFNYQSNLKVKNFPFLMGQGNWMDSSKLSSEDTLKEVLKHGSLTVGFIGLAETLIALTGKHHGECEKAQKLGLQIVSHMRNRMDEATQRHHLNFALIATPAEGLSGRFVAMDKERFGVIEGVTDKEYYTNSFHVPVYYKTSAFNKIETEAPYHALTNGGHISYIELDGDMSNNPEAFERIVLAMKDSGIGYGSINHPIDIDPVCGYQGFIKDECPGCGRKESEDGIPFDHIRRITGYLTGTTERFNDAKRSEERDRVSHL